jgi:mannitol-1-phosphate 5-dehydrogenase
METVVQFGAGSIGRGFVGQLFSEAGLEVVFVDVAHELVAGLNARRSYPLELVGPDRRERLEVAPVRAVRASDADAVAREVAGAALACTAVGVAALPHVARSLARGIAARQRAGAPPLNVILCENQLRCGELVRGLLEQALVDGGGASVESVLAGVGLVEAVVSRMVPVLPAEVQAREPLLVLAEDYARLPVDRAGIIGALPPVPGLQPVDRFAAWQARKLYVHNLGHAACAYLGYLRGHVTIADAVADPSVGSLARPAMEEAGRALCRRHGFDREELRVHIDNLMRRFANRALPDTVARVGRDPARKLAPQDRLVGALLLCRDEGIEPAAIVTATAAALRFDLASDPGAVALQARLRSDGLDATLRMVCGLPPGSEVAGWIRGGLERLSVVAP